MNKRNYQKELESLCEKIKVKPTLLLHCCCAPCSSYTLEFLEKYFRIFVLFYNPNISIKEEYEKRRKEVTRFIDEYTFSEQVEWIEADYTPEVFLELSKGLETAHEGGERCLRCYELRLQETAKVATDSNMNFDYFCTTLSISPLKDADKLMEIGERLACNYGVKYLPSDFKKKNGYKRSIELSKEYNLYRQNYCGCIYSKG